MIDGCGAFRTVGCNHVIGANEAGSVVAGADRNHIWIVTRSGDGGVALCAVRIVASVIARRDHYDDACFPGSFHSLAQRIDLVRGGNRTPQREVDHADVVTGRPSERLITRMLYLLLREIAASMAAITFESWPLPWLSRTFGLIRLASRATPSNHRVSWPKK